MMLNHDDTADTIESQDMVLIRWLRSCYLQASALPGLGSGQFSMLDLAVARSQLLNPFIRGVTANGQLEIGLPTNHDVVKFRFGEQIFLAHPCWINQLDDVLLLL